MRVSAAAAAGKRQVVEVQQKVAISCMSSAVGQEIWTGDTHIVVFRLCCCRPTAQHQELLGICSVHAKRNCWVNVDAQEPQGFITEI